MNRILALVICFTLVIGISGSFIDNLAAAEIDSGIPTLVDSLPRHAWGVGGEISYINYKEPAVMEEEGMMHGVFVFYTYRGWLPPAPSDQDDWRMTLEARYSQGEVDYHGRLNNGTAHTFNDIDDYLFEVRTLAGREFARGNNCLVIPYFGLGYRYLNDALQEDATGYERESEYFYVPLGIEIIKDLKINWRVSIRFEYDFFLFGEQQTNYSGNPSLNRDDLSNDQRSGYGLRSSVKLEKEIGSLNFTVQPSITYWHIDKSETKRITNNGVPTGSVGWEPKNHSTEYGIRLGLEF